MALNRMAGKGVGSRSPILSIIDARAINERASAE
jgi:hypothetical protein